MIFHVGAVDVELDFEYLDNLEDYFSAADALTKDMEPKDNEPHIVYVRRCCEAILKFFDDVCGEGTSISAFGDRIKVRDVYKAFRSFSKEVNALVRDIASDMALDTEGEEDIAAFLKEHGIEIPQRKSSAVSAGAMNREQRRAAAKSGKSGKKKANIIPRT